MTAKTDARTHDILVNLGAHLRKIRKSVGMQQAELARLIRMEPTNLAKIERGEKNVTIDTLVRVAHGLGVSLSVRFVRKQALPVAAAEPRVRR